MKLRQIIKEKVKAALVSVLTEELEKALEELLGEAPAPAAPAPAAPAAPAPAPKRRGRWVPEASVISAIAQRLQDNKGLEDKVRIIENRAKRLGQTLGTRYLEALQRLPVNEASKVYKYGLRDLEAWLSDLP